MLDVCFQVKKLSRKEHALHSQSSVKSMSKLTKGT